jgi:UDP-2-acetamido-3-amino-2,3-dideoxy-glucuronate N-acetyltransferase
MPISRDVRLGAGVRIPQPELVNLYGCIIGDHTTIGAFVEIQAGAAVGNRCKISSHSFICEGVTLEDEVFVGHSVVFINDRYPRATRENGQLQGSGDWDLELTRVCRRASIGSHATILCGLVIGEGATIAAGSVVTRTVPPFAVVAGAPAREIHIRRDERPA